MANKHTQEQDTNVDRTLGDNSVVGIINRGEAAMRFIRAVREFNALHGTSMRTVAFYIDAEEDALFVQEADRAVALSGLPLHDATGGSPYLNKELLLQALLSSGCDALWVGWGFVSEDAAFVEMVEQAELVFLGPSSGSMSLLGDKIAAKDLAESADVPILPWSRGPVRTLEEAQAVSQKIGYPVIVKASNAGGGRGIRFVHTAAELESQLRSAQEETLRITGNDIVFIEQLVVTGRHLEVQTITDRHANVLTFGVRDCSVQRRNQKIIEETPPPLLGGSEIAAIEQAAARLISAAGYQSAGTVEFLYDVDRREYYFMEVNTRLQVEHPITEQLYGFDLVQGQILVARGQILSAEHCVARGHVMEVRLNAEDPDREFSPAPGRVTLFSAPAGPGIRVDSGIQQGSSIPSDFDSMVAKVIASGSTRREAIARLTRALSEMRIRIEGGTTNRAFLLQLLDTPEILAGGVHTRFVEELLQRESAVIRRDKWDVALLACAVARYLEAGREELSNFKQQLSATGHPRDIAVSHGRGVDLSAQGVSYNLLVKAVGGAHYHIDCGEDSVALTFRGRDHQAEIVYRGQRHRVQIVQRGDALQCEVGAVPYKIEVESSGYVRAPSPSIVLTVHAQPGQTVARGDLLLSLEAMKMEMLVSATETGVVKEVLVRPGEQVAAGQPLAQIESGEQEQAAPAEGATVRFLAQPSETTADQWDRLARDYRAVFLGYDHRDDPSAILNHLLDFSEDHKEHKQKLPALLLEGVALYPAIEILFSQTPLHAEGMARPASARELLSHYFRRQSDKHKGLPEQFLHNLQAALAWYPEIDESGTDSEKMVLLRIYRSHADLAAKQRLLQRSLVLLEQYAQQVEVSTEIANSLDQIALLAQPAAPALADAAIHARYVLVDRELLQTLTTEKRANVERVLELIKTHSRNDTMLSRLRRNIVDAGHHVLPELALAAIGPDGPKARIALEMIARRFVRDRIYQSGEVVAGSHNPMFLIRSSDGTRRFSTLLVVTPAAALAETVDELQKADANELIALTVTESGSTLDVWPPLKSLQGGAERLSIGLLGDHGSQQFRTYVADADSTLHEDESIRGINPLQYRELRIGRLQNFTKKQIYASESVWLLHATAIANPRDERLFALVEVPTARFERDDQATIRRMVALENVFMEAVYAMRAAQASATRRLYWNRIIINIRGVLNASVDQIRDYAVRLAARMTDLGIEKLVIYSRRPSSTQQNPEEVELLFENISGTSFTLRGRTPSDEPLTPMDEYVAKVVRARQRGTLYPYETIKMITRSGYPVYETFPKGDFEEFDITSDPHTGADRAVSVADRPYGQNSCNIVFGIISNNLEGFARPVRRVIILSDTTGDLGSLAEKECRRINAALDLAEQRRIPVEWLPISAGARIDMDSGTENLDWTAATLRRIIEFTQAGGEINVIVAGINVGAQSYWNAEATMLMHTRGLLIMTEDASMLLTGKKALDFSGSVSAEDNVGIGGFARIMGPNGQAQIGARSLYEAYTVLLRHYSLTYVQPDAAYPERRASSDPVDRDVALTPYRDSLGQGFSTIGDIFSAGLNPERKKPFDMRQVMRAVIDHDADALERWYSMQDSETAIVWEARLGGYAIGVIGIESRSLTRIGEVPHDGPESWTGGTLFPLSSKKAARGLNAFSGRVPVVVLANLSGFDGSPESLRKLQLEYGAEIGRAVVNFQGPLIFVVTARYHGGAYVVFSKSLNSSLQAVALEGSYASVIGGAPASAVVFPGVVRKHTWADPRVAAAQARLANADGVSQKEFDDLVQQVHAEKQASLAQQFDSIHSVERARKVGSIDEIISVRQLRPYLANCIERALQQPPIR